MQTFAECIDRKLFGMPSSPSNNTSLTRIVPHYTLLFLYNADDKRLHGVFQATAAGAHFIVPHAWTSPWYGVDQPVPNMRTRFGAQVQVSKIRGPSTSRVLLVVRHSNVCI